MKEILNQVDPDNSEDQEIYTIKEEPDLDFVNGGVSEVHSAEDNFFQTTDSHMCNCGRFEPLIPGVSLNVCSNCKHGRVDAKDPKKFFCSKQNA